MEQHNVLFVLTNQDGIVYKMCVRTELDDDSLTDAICAAAKEYLNTEDGLEVWYDNCENFNYGDFITYMPSDICTKHGFTLIESDNDSNTTVIEDDYDTTLAEPDDY